MTAANKTTAFSMIASRLCPMMLAQIMLISRTDTSGPTLPAGPANRGRRWCNATPNTTGATTTCNAVPTIPQPSTGIHAPASKWVNTGVTTTAATVEQNVITTDKATFARAINATTFDAVPPGQHATIITPTARSGGNRINVATNHPTAGMMVNCATNPIPTALGIRKTALNAPVSNVTPIPNMMNANAQVIHDPENQMNPSGHANAAPQNTINHTGNQFAAARSRACILGSKAPRAHNAKPHLTQSKPDLRAPWEKKLAGRFHTHHLCHPFTHASYYRDGPSRPQPTGCHAGEFFQTRIPSDPSNRASLKRYPFS